MHEAQLGVDEVPVVLDALALGGDHVEPMGFVVLGDLERSTGLDRSQYAHEALGDPVVLRDRSCEVLFGLAGMSGGRPLQVDAWPPGLLRAVLSVLTQGIGRGLGPLAELGERNPLVPQERLDATGVVEAQEVALEDHPVEHGQAPGDAAPMYIFECAHLDLPEDSDPTRRIVSSGPQGFHRDGYAMSTADPSAQGRLCRPGTGSIDTSRRLPAAFGRKRSYEVKWTRRPFGCGRRLR